MLETFVILVVALVGIITQAIIGFGLALFLVPALLVYFNPPVSITVTLLAGSVISLIILFNERRTSELSRPIVLKLFLAAIPGSLLGSYIVTHIDKALLQIIVGILIIIGVVVQEYFFPKPTKPLRASRGIITSGFAAGILNACAAMAPPPILLWMRSHVTTPNQIRHNLAALFVLLNTFSIITIHFLKPESFSSKGIMIFVYLLPVLLVGTIIGKMLARKVNTKQYEQMIFVAIIAAGILSVVLGLQNL